MSEHEHKSCALNLDVACCICQPHGCHLSSPQQQPEEEPIGANLDQTGEETLNRLKEAAKNLTGSEEHSCNPNEAHQQQPECKCKKTGTFVTFTGDCPIHAPQQTEQWMVGLEELVRKWSYDEMTSTDVLIARLKSFIKSQIEAAKREEREVAIAKINSLWKPKPESIAGHTGEERIFNAGLVAAIGVLTNHN